MSTPAFLAILLSALCHAAYNALVKTSDQKVIFYWSMYSAAVFLILVLAPMLPPQYVVPEDPALLFYAGLSALFYTLYHLATGKAYASEGGDLSLSYPLSTTAPLYIPVLAYLFFHEIISTQALYGILILFIGAYGIQLRLGAADAPRRLNRNRQAVRYALLAGFLYSFGAIADKKGVMQANFYVFTSYVILLMFLMLTLTVLADPALRRRWFDAYRSAPGLVLLSGAILYASFFLYRYALETTRVSHAASVRQVSALFAVLIGVRLLGEPYGMLRLAATLVIIAGVVLIKTG
jgi:uncharacterized membrane protein